MTLSNTEALVLFYLHLALILWYPWPPNSMLCRCCGLCSQRNTCRKINIVLGGKGRKCVQDTRKSNFITKCLNTIGALCSPKVSNTYFWLSLICFIVLMCMCILIPYIHVILKFFCVCRDWKLCPNDVTWSST